jgi:hypothetical protein
VKRKHKQYFLYYLKDNIFIFDVFDYIEELAADYVDYCFEWNLIKDNVVIERNTRIKEFIQVQVSLAQVVMNDKLRKCNCRALCYFNPKNDLNLWVDYVKDPQKFIKIAKSVIKKKLPNFFEVQDNNLFKSVKGDFQGIPCLDPTGEDEDFLLKSLKKLK